MVTNTISRLSIRLFMGHLPIVNQETLVSMIRDGFISTRGNLKRLMIKTTSDIFSDVLATREDDLIFPWIIRSRVSENIGFKYVFSVAGPPVFVKGDQYPVKVPLQSEGLEFDVPLSEAEALDLWKTKLLWNIIGKKSLGRGRSLTHQMPMEDERLLELLNSKNSVGPYEIKLNKSDTIGVPITIDPSQDNWDPSLERRLNSLEPEDRLSSLDLNGIPWRRGSVFAYEKTLEAWIMENLDKSPCNVLRELALETNEIEWFGNYLPFGVQGGNMDVVIVQSKDDGKIVSVIELKLGRLNVNELKKAAVQSIEYSHFIKNAFNAYGIKVEMNPIVLSARSGRFPVPTIKGIKPTCIQYDIDNKGVVSFRKA